MKRMAFLQTLLFIFLCSSFSFSKIHYVSNDGSFNGNGSLTDPFNRISTAYNAAVLNGQNEVIKLMPGNYYESDILIFNNKKITMSGYGDQSVISNNIIVKSDMSFANLYIQGSFSNESFVVFDNVKCDDTDIDLESISGTWRGNENEMHINFLSDPIDGMEAVNLDSVNTHVSNCIAEAGFATEDYVDTKQITTTNIADNAIDIDKLNTTSVDTRYLKKSGDIAGILTVTNLNVYPGRFGVGTKKPDVLFHVKELTGESGILHFEGLDGGLFRIDTFAGHVNLDNIKDDGFLYMGRDMTGNGYICMGKSSSGIANTLVIPTGSNPYVGKIGIGTSIPQAKLDVKGKIKSEQTTSGDSDDTVVTKKYVDDCFKGFNYDARYVYIDKYYEGSNGFSGTLQAPYTNFYHALNVLGENSFFGATTPIVYHVGNGRYSFPPNNPDGINRSFKIGIIGNGAYYRNINSDLNGNSTAFTEMGTYIDEIYSARQDGNVNIANAILHLKDLVVSNVYLFSFAHDDIYCDNAVFLNENHNGQQHYHGQYYIGKMNWGANCESLDNDTLRPGYYNNMHLSNLVETTEKINNATNAAINYVYQNYVKKSGSIMSGSLTVPHINITGSTDWSIGSANQRADIVIKNPNTEIRSENGDVILNASANKIIMKSPVKFSADQFGSATIPADSSTITITDKNISSGAVILLTPCDEVSGAPYAQINTDGTFDIKLSETVVTPTVINYLILE